MGRLRQCKYCYGKPLLGQGVCRECAARPKAENIRLDRLWSATGTVGDFLLQSRISERNIKTMESMRDIQDETFQSFLNLVNEIAAVHPYRRRRWEVIREKHESLWERILAHEYFDWILDEDQDMLRVIHYRDS